MSVRLSVGDCVLINTETGSDMLGLIKYIGYIHEKMNMNTESIGVELLEPIPNGHDGTINGYKYFKCSNGHGIHIQINDVVKKLTVSELMMKFQCIMNVFKTKVSQYITALNERDKYIEKLKHKQKDLKSLLNRSTTVNNKKDRNSNNYIKKHSVSSRFVKTAHVKAERKSKAIDISNIKQSDKMSEATNSQTQNQNCNTAHPIQPIQTYHSASPIYFTQIQPTVYNNQYPSIQSPLSPLSPIQYQFIPTHQSHIHYKQIQSMKAQQQQNTVIMPQYVTHQTHRQQMMVSNGISMCPQKINIGSPNIERRATQ